jgi:hypothetical protein
MNPDEPNKPAWGIVTQGDNNILHYNGGAFSELLGSNVSFSGWNPNATIITFPTPAIVDIIDMIDQFKNGVPGGWRGVDLILTKE